jgi:hypothetical protein
MKGTHVRNILLTILLIPTAASAGQSDVSDYSSLAFEVLYEGQVVHGATLVASGEQNLYRSGSDQGTLRLSCAAGRRTLSSTPLFEGIIVKFSLQSDQIRMHVRESKIERKDDQIARVPVEKCEDLAATEMILVDRSFLIPADTAGNAEMIDLGEGYRLRAVTHRISRAKSP